MLTWGYHLDKHLDEFEDTSRINKEARILDVAAGTGMVGEKVGLCLFVRLSLCLNLSSRKKITVVFLDTIPYQ